MVVIGSGIAARCCDARRDVKIVAHHLDKLVKVNLVVPVAVDALDHQLALLQVDGLPQRAHDGEHLLRSNTPVVVRVEHLEHAAQLVVFAARRHRHHRDKLVEVDLVVAVDVERAHHRLDFRLGVLLCGANLAKGLCQLACGDALRK